MSEAIGERILGLPGWIEAAGGSVERTADGHSAHGVEISPLYALDEAELRQKSDPSLKFTGELLLQ